MIRRIYDEFDTGDDSHDLKVRCYDTLERMHKQEGWTDDQQQHFEAGWEAAILYLRTVIRKDA